MICSLSKLMPSLNNLLRFSAVSSDGGEVLNPPKCLPEEIVFRKLDRARLEGERAERETELIHERETRAAPARN